jgi:hypothetical protein
VTKSSAGCCRVHAEGNDQKQYDRRVNAAAFTTGDNDEKDNEIAGRAREHP